MLTRDMDVSMAIDLFYEVVAIVRSAPYRRSLVVADLVETARAIGGEAVRCLHRADARVEDDEA